MWSIGEIKARGKAAFKANYWNSVIVAFILSILTAGSSVATRNQTGSEDVQESLLAADPMVLQIIAGGLFAIMIVSLLLRIFIFNPLQVGGYQFFKKNVTEGHATLGTIGEGFSGYGHTFITLLLRDIFLALWCCLFVIPGLIKSYSYRMVPYIIKDNPELSATEVITKSRKMMDGHKWRAFLLDLSFIGWLLLSLVTLGIVGLLWTNPYMQNTNAALYQELSKNN
ncbi:MAG: DUF975 family protein [Pseudobutyrivibrio sp.]|uniref:DUF975 family protein n=1 Tax=Pseudobutyrivibrio sp. TaxID=2014367 RepID=UPI0025E83BEB|nr:DUF975 family protein [Pseudobutyrivibrio sp.]MBQ8489244.1 DUF975 family protein [Pseudobutyrivibrio sp.]